MSLKLENLLAEVMGIPAEAVTNDLAMKDLDAWDSLKHMELVVSLEQSFGLELTFDEIVAMRSVREIKRVLKEKTSTS